MLIFPNIVFLIFKFIIYLKNVSFRKLFVSGIFSDDWKSVHMYQVPKKACEFLISVLSLVSNVIDKEFNAQDSWMY